MNNGLFPGALIFLSGITSSKSGNPASLRTFGDPPSKVKFSNPFPSVLPTATVSVSGTFHFFYCTSISVLPILILILLPVLFTGGSNERARKPPASRRSPKESFSPVTGSYSLNTRCASFHPTSSSKRP